MCPIRGFRTDFLVVTQTVTDQAVRTSMFRTCFGLALRWREHDLKCPGRPAWRATRRPRSRARVAAVMAAFRCAAEDTDCRDRGSRGQARTRTRCRARQQPHMYRSPQPGRNGLRRGYGPDPAEIWQAPREGSDVVCPVMMPLTRLIALSRSRNSVDVRP